MIDNRTVITGSFYWSPSASHQNDELLLVIESPLLAALFTREMDRLWRGAELGINGRLARKLAANRRRCTSGVVLLAALAHAASVLSIGDGDTIAVTKGSRRIKVRLASIDAPETSQSPYGIEASRG